MSPSKGPLAELIAELPAALRKQALTHYSWVEDRADSYKRLAFLGDRVLSLAVADDVQGRFPDADRGRAAKIHMQAVRGVSCAMVGHQLGIPEMLEALEPETETPTPVKVLSAGKRPIPEMTEALIGACFLTFGFERTQAAVIAAFAQFIEAGKRPRQTPLSRY